MWDLLITIGNLIILPAMLGTALDSRSYVPRLTSGFSFVGVMAVFVGLLGAGLILSTLTVGGVAAVWAFIFIFRGTAPSSPTLKVEPPSAVAPESVTAEPAPALSRE
jgi:hypothetical protein